MLFLLHSPLTAAHEADIERAVRQAGDRQRDGSSRRALLLQLTRGRRAPRPAHA